MNVNKHAELDDTITYENQFSSNSTSYAIPQNLQLLVTANQPLCKSLGIVNHDLLN